MRSGYMRSRYPSRNPRLPHIGGIQLLHSDGWGVHTWRAYTTTGLRLVTKDPWKMIAKSPWKKLTWKMADTYMRRMG